MLSACWEDTSIEILGASRQSSALFSSAAGELPLVPWDGTVCSSCFGWPVGTDWDGCFYSCYFLEGFICGHIFLTWFLDCCPSWKYFLQRFTPLAWGSIFRTSTTSPPCDSYWAGTEVLTPQADSPWNCFPQTLDASGQASSWKMFSCRNSTSSDT